MKTHRLMGIFEDRRRIYTRPKVAKSIYGEKIIQGYREWDPNRSKLGAAIQKGVSQIGMKPDSIILYLGCSTGTTVSHVSDMLTQGHIYALDSAPRVMRDLVMLAQERENIIPILSDANLPTAYTHIVPVVDCVFMDIAQPNQVAIFLKNVATYLKTGGFGLLAVKSRSIDISKSPKAIYAQTKAELEKHVTIVDFRTLDPFEKDHAIFVIKKK